MSEDPQVEVAPETAEAPVEAPAEPSQESAEPQPKPKAKAKPRKKPDPIIDALPAEAELPPAPEPPKRKKAAPKATAGLPDVPPKAKRVKKVQLPHEVPMADTTEPPYAAPAITHTELHTMFRSYLGNHKILNQQAKRDMYRQWLTA